MGKESIGGRLADGGCTQLNRTPLPGASTVAGRNAGLSPLAMGDGLNGCGDPIHHADQQRGADQAAGEG
jgi:hypothetical protein